MKENYKYLDSSYFTRPSTAKLSNSEKELISLINCREREKELVASSFARFYDRSEILELVVRCLKIVASIGDHGQRYIF